MVIPKHDSSKKSVFFRAQGENCYFANYNFGTEPYLIEYCRIILAEDFQPSSFALTMLDAKRKWNWDLVHEDLKITSGFVENYLLDK